MHALRDCAFDACSPPILRLEQLGLLPLASSLQAFVVRGGMLMDFPYAPTQIVSILGSCRRVTGFAAVSLPERRIVPDAEYDRFLAQATDPDDANYWKVVVTLPRSEPVTMEAEDNVFSLYEMDCGAIGAFHIARALHPLPPGLQSGGLRIFGTEGNLVIGGTGHGGQYNSVTSVAEMVEFEVEVGAGKTRPTTVAVKLHSVVGL